MAELLGSSRPLPARAPDQAGSDVSVRDNLRSRLENCLNVLNQCHDLASSIESHIIGPQPSTDNKKDMPVQGLSALTLELSNTARLLRDRLEMIAYSLA